MLAWNNINLIQGDRAINGYRKLLLLGFVVTGLVFAPSPVGKHQAEKKYNDEAATAYAAEPPAKPVCASGERLQSDTRQCTKKPVEPVKKAEKPTCASELKKYDWPQSIAYRVMMQESSNIAHNKNDNPRTGDYSIGCFQVNIIGDLAKNRPSERELMNPVVNVKFAYALWSETRDFHAHWTNTCSIIGC